MPRFSPTTIFLDSNILFSASRSLQSRFHEFWHMHEVTPLTSLYSINEVRNNITAPGHLRLFEDLLARTTMVSDGALHLVPDNVSLVAKDRPILATAISARANYLITGDANHFGHLYGTLIAGVTTLPPATFLNLFTARLIR